nr:MAG TPA: hypothetical protein [Caudoviricetes sp.]
MYYLPKDKTLAKFLLLSLVFILIVLNVRNLKIVKQ